MHPFFQGIDWFNIHRYPAPFQPELKSPDDTRHFDSDIPAEVTLFSLFTSLDADGALTAPCTSQRGCT